MIKKILILLVLFLIYNLLNNISKKLKNKKEFNINSNIENTNTIDNIENIKFNFNFNYNLNTNHIVQKINSIEYKIVRLLNNYIRLEYPSKNNKKYIRNYYLKNIEWENIKNNNDFSLNLKLTHEDTFGKSMKNSNNEINKSKLIINIPIIRNDNGNYVFNKFWRNKNNIPSQKYDKENVWIKKNILSFDLKCLSESIKILPIRNRKILESINNGTDNNVIDTEPLKLESIFYDRIKEILLKFN